MARQFDKTRIQNAIRDIVSSVEYFPITYDGDSEDHAALGETAIDPSSVEVNQTAFELAVDPRYGRSLVRTPTEWSFELILKFPKEVSLNELVQTLLESPIVPRNTEQNHPQVTLKLTDASFDEPTRKSSSGTKATFTFDAEVERA